MLEVALILAICYTAPISGRVWLFVMPFAVGLVALEELRKWLVRRCAAWRADQFALPHRYTSAVM